MNDVAFLQVAVGFPVPHVVHGYDLSLAIDTVDDSVVAHPNSVQGLSASQFDGLTRKWVIC